MPVSWNCFEEKLQYYLNDVESSTNLGFCCNQQGNELKVCCWEFMCFVFPDESGAV